MFTPRTTPVIEGEQPFAWNVPSVYQCTWFCFFEGVRYASEPTWWDRATETGSYTNAKEWLLNYRDPWIPITDPDYKPVQGDILVYGDGEYGHVIFCETDVMTAEYRSGDPDSFRVAKVGDFNGTLLGVLHYPYSPVTPVERNPEVDQIQTTDESLRIRTKPSLEGEIVGHVQLGYYNVLQSKENDGYKWYEIARDRWCANITTEFLPKDNDNFVKEFEEFLDRTKKRIKSLEDENSELKDDMHHIEEITEKWDASDTL